MAGTLILDSDLMVLQREGFFDIKDEFYVDKFPDQFDNIRIDTEIYHFTGEDLRYSVVEYALDSGRFVKTTGDKMTGNLEIHVPVDGEIEDSPNLVLQGYRAGSSPYAEITFKNRARNPMTTQVIGAIAPTDPSVRETHFKINSTAITKAGQIMMSGDKLNICALSNGASLNYITAASWDPTSNSIASDIPTNSRRLTWDSRGGSLYNSSKQVVRWDDDAFYVLGNTADGDPVFRVRDDYARYTGVIKNGNDIVTKEYADGQDSKSIPLKGTRATEADLGYTLEQDAVDGPIDFTSDASLNALANNKLVFARNNSVKLSIGSDSDDNVNLYNCNLDVHDNKIQNVPDPDLVDQTDPDAKNAVPKRYIDEVVQELKDKFDNVSFITAPPGMINAWPGNVADGPPTGWYFCDGTTEYYPINNKKMHIALGGSEADWDGENANTPYKTPNLKGRFLAQHGTFYVSGKGNVSPVGTYPRRFVSQSTALPYKNRTSTSNGVAYKYLGEHQHVITDYQFKNAFNHSNFEVWTAMHNGHKHVTGTTFKSAKGDGSSGRWDPNDYISSNASSSDTGGAHEHKITYKDKQSNPNKANPLFYTNNGGFPIYEGDFDDFTLPYAYTINWIIKHD